MGRHRLCARGIGSAIYSDGSGEFHGDGRKGTAWLRNGPIATLRLMCRGDFINTTMRHGITALSAARQGVKLVSTIAILFGGIIEETATALKVFSIIFGATCVDITAKKGLRHREFGDKDVGGRVAIRNGTA
jgi:hypothetical protein